MLRKKVTLFVSFLILCLIISSFVSASFNVGSLLIKMSIQGDGSATKPIKISSDTGGQFNLELFGLQGANLSENAFTLSPGGEKIITLKVNSTGIAPAVYAGSIKITGPGKEVYLPVILEIESKDVFFDANLDISPQYTQIIPGGKIVAQIKTFDLTSGGTSPGLGAQSVYLYYKIYNLKGDIISSENERVVIDKETQATKTVSFSKDVPEGDYVFSVTVKYLSSVGESTQLFSVKKQSFLDDFSGSNFQFLVIVGAVILFFLGMILFFAYILRGRDKLIIEMKKYNSIELARHEHLLHEQVHIAKKRGVNTSSLEKEVSQKIKQLKAKQAQRVRELNVLKKEGTERSLNEMQKKVREWKNKGYNINGSDYKLKGLTTKEMQQAMEEWRRKYAIKGYKKK